MRNSFSAETYGFSSQRACTYMCRHVTDNVSPSLRVPLIFPLNWGIFFPSSLPPGTTASFCGGVVDGVCAWVWGRGSRQASDCQEGGHCVWWAAARGVTSSLSPPAPTVTSKQWGCLQAVSSEHKQGGASQSAPYPTLMLTLTSLEKSLWFFLNDCSILCWSVLLFALLPKREFLAFVFFISLAWKIKSIFRCDWNTMPPLNCSLIVTTNIHLSHFCNSWKDALFSDYTFQ